MVYNNIQKFISIQR